MLDPRVVVCATAPGTAYGPCEPEAAPELVGGVAADCALRTVRRVFALAGLDADRFGTPEWNPLGDLIAPGSRVVLKPNWVLHLNKSGYNLDSLVTHTSVLQAILTYLVKVEPDDVVVGDAPLQGCDFAVLSRAACFETLREVDGALPLSIRDFRRKVLVTGPGAAGRLGDPVTMTSRTDDDYRIVDLGTQSSLEPIAGDDPQFRVTMYDPDALQEKHCAGRHQYLVAREILDADVVINVPKLKTHMKAGITGALKNMVGMNGLKDYLPHHRKGGRKKGGDCYAGDSFLKSIAEDLLDASNRSRSSKVQRGLALAAAASARASTLFGHERQLEGGWHGNDTVWRMCLDLQRILHYAQSDGTIGSTPARKVISITDAIIAGDGEGPLSPIPVPLGLVTLSSNVAAAEWVHCHLMQWDPQRIPLVREAFGDHPLPLAPMGPDEIKVILPNGRIVPAYDLPESLTVGFAPPDGWVGHVERVLTPT